MESVNLIESFSLFKEDKNIDRATLMSIIEDVFRTMLIKKYGSDKNFDIIVNPDKGDIEIYKNRTIVDDEFAEDSFDYAYPGGNVYGATKAFVDQFTLNLRADLIGTGVRATNIAPGLCGGTEFSNVRFKGDDSKAASVYLGTEPLTAIDIAETAYWIASLPPHININYIEMMPTCQGFSPFAIKRN